MSSVSGGISSLKTKFGISNLSYISNINIHWVLLLRALFLRALDFRALSFIVNKGCVIGKKHVASEFLLSISAYFTFAHTPFTRTIYFCHLCVKEVPSVLFSLIVSMNTVKEPWQVSWNHGSYHISVQYHNVFEYRSDKSTLIVNRATTIQCRSS